jgi:hypothetical protein
MPSALYYPHTTIRNPGLIKTALLLWDDVTCIVPERDWRPQQTFKEKALNEAIELITKYHVPSLQEKESAHNDVGEFLREDGSRFLIANALGSRFPNRFLMYPNKFLHETWHMLQREGLARWDEMSLDYGVPPVLGLLMMSSLADSCAGTQFDKITDRVDAYGLIQRSRATLLGAPYVEGLDSSQIAPDLQRLVTISLRVLDARRISVAKLVAMRKREAKSHTADYRKMRVRYFSTLKTYADRIVNHAKTVKDVKAIEMEFQLDLRDDLKSLKKELGVASLESLFSKEMAVTLLALAGSLVSPIAGITTLAATLKGVGVVPLVATTIKHKKERRKALLAHNMSWLYYANQPRIAVR